MKPTESLEQVVAEGRRLLAAKDKRRAHAFFTTATQLSPKDKDLWLLRAETAEDSLEVVECLEQVLALDPHDTAVQTRLMSERLSALQAEAQTEGEGGDSGKRPRFRLPSLSRPTSPGGMLMAGVLAIVLCLIIALVVPALAVVLNENRAGNGIEGQPAAAAIKPMTLPPTWTPSPTRTPTNTPTVTPTPHIVTTARLTVRAGPGTNYLSLGSLAPGAVVFPVGRSSDGTHLLIQWPDATHFGWIIASAVTMDQQDVMALPTRIAPPTVVIRIPTAVPTARPPDTPTPVYDYILGRPPDYIADCSRPWKVAGTVYDSPNGGRRNGVSLKIWAFDQVQATVTSGSFNTSMPGYWEWGFAPGVDIQGKVAVVYPDGSLRSQPVAFHLTGYCGGSGAVTQMIIDFTGK